LIPHSFISNTCLSSKVTSVLSRPSSTKIFNMLNITSATSVYLDVE
jgi:hypothetical protein